MKKNVAILTSGGDCSGMNACIYYATKFANKNGVKLYGVYDGYKGLVNNDIREIDLATFKGKKYNGGTALGTARLKEFAELEYQVKAAENLRKNNIDTLIVCGGDGSFKGATKLAKQGIKVYGIPCTIDNDIYYTDTTTGFLTCVDIVSFCLDAIRDTMTSHRRVGIVEVMGRDHGEIALYAGLKSNAEVILLPEEPMSLEEIKKILISNRNNGKKGQLICLSEGVCSAKELRKKLEEICPDFEFRDTCLGHVQRGGKSTREEVDLAKKFVEEIYRLHDLGIYNKAIGIRDNQIISEDFDNLVNYTEHKVNKDLYSRCNKIEG